MKDFQAPEEVTSPIKNIGKTYFAFFVYHFVLPDKMRIRKRKEQYCMYSIYSIFCTRSALLCGRSLRYPHRCGSAKHPHMVRRQDSNREQPSRR